MLANACECLQMLANACECLQMLANACKWQMHANACKCLRMLANACKWQKIAKSDKKWQKMTKNGLKMLENGVFSGIKLFFPQHQKMIKFIIFWAFLDETTDCGHFSPFLACFWPVVTLVSVSKALNECIFPSYDRMEWDWQKKSE